MPNSQNCYVVLIVHTNDKGGSIGLCGPVKVDIVSDVPAALEKCQQYNPTRLVVARIAAYEGDGPRPGAVLDEIRDRFPKTSKVLGGWYDVAASLACDTFDAITEGNR